MITKKQHYVPKFYLKNFVNPSKQLYYYQRETGEFGASTPDYLCYIDYLYEPHQLASLSNDDPNKTLLNYIEKELSKFEDDIAPDYMRLLACCNRHEFAGKDFERGRKAICKLTANLLVRHPAFFQEELTYAPKLTKAYLAELGLTEPEEGFFFNLDIVSEIAILKTLLIPGAEDVPYNRFRESLLNKRLIIIEAPLGSGFITSSLPLYYLRHNLEGYDFDVAYIPLSSKYTAMFTSNADVCSFSMASIDEVTELNAALLLENDYWETAMAFSKSVLYATLLKWNQFVFGN